MKMSRRKERCSWQRLRHPSGPEMIQRFPKPQRILVRRLEAPAPRELWNGQSAGSTSLVCQRFVPLLEQQLFRAQRGRSLTPATRQKRVELQSVRKREGNNRAHLPRRFQRQRSTGSGRERAPTMYRYAVTPTRPAVTFLRRKAEM